MLIDERNGSLFGGVVATGEVVGVGIVVVDVLPGGDEVVADRVVDTSSMVVVVVGAEVVVAADMVVVARVVVVDAMLGPVVVDVARASVSAPLPIASTPPVAMTATTRAERSRVLLFTRGVCHFGVS